VLSLLIFSVSLFERRCFGFFRWCFFLLYLFVLFPLRLCLAVASASNGHLRKQQHDDLHASHQQQEDESYQQREQQIQAEADERKTHVFMASRSNGFSHQQPYVS